MNNKMEEHEIEFVAYSRKLLRCLERIKQNIETGENDKAILQLDELIEDTKGDIQ